MNNNSTSKPAIFQILSFMSNIIPDFILGIYNFLMHFIFLMFLPLILIAVPFVKRFKLGFFNYFGLFFPAQLKFIKNARRNGRKFYIIHGVSVGEIKLAKFVMAEILRNDASAVFALTTTAPDSFAEASKLQFENRVLPLFFPIDLPLFWAIFFNSLRPESIFIIEVDFWPNFLIAAAIRKIPVYLLNGRISDKTLNFYLSIKKFSGSLLSLITMFFMQTADDSCRIVQMGAAPEAVATCGNMKFDLSKTGADREKVSILNEVISSCFKNEYNFIITAGSTHPDEETCIIEALYKVKKQAADFNPLLIIAPRKTVRTSEIYQALSNNSTVKLFSEFTGINNKKNSLEKNTDDNAKTASCRDFYAKINAGSSNDFIKVILIDKMGFLISAYAVSDAAYIGGTMSKADIGGHNIIEPAIFGIPVFFGSGIRNFKDSAAELKKSEIVWQIASLDELSEKIKFLYLNQTNAAIVEGKRKLLDIIAQNSNVTEKIFLAIKENQWKDRLHSIL